MKRWAQTMQAAVQMLAELADQEWRSLDEWRGQSAVQGPLFGQLCAWIERGAGQPIWQRFVELRQEQRDVSGRVREELFVLLGKVDPREAMVVLCRLPMARALGYSRERLSRQLGVSDAELQAWEEQAFEKMATALSPQMPMLWALREMVEGGGLTEQGGANVGQGDVASASMQEGARVNEGAHDSVMWQGRAIVGQGGVASAAMPGGSRANEGAFASDLLQGDPNATLGGATGNGLTNTPSERHMAPSFERSPLLRAARHQPWFDLRAHMSPQLELAIRQAFHRMGLAERERVEGLFHEEDRLAVALVAERMRLELGDGKEVRMDD